MNRKVLVQVFIVWTLIFGHLPISAKASKLDSFKKIVSEHKKGAGLTCLGTVAAVAGLWWIFSRGNSSVNKSPDDKVETPKDDAVQKIELWESIEPSPNLLKGDEKFPLIGSKRYVFNSLLKNLSSSMNIDKYERYVEELINEGVISSKEDIFIQDVPLSIEALSDVHSEQYLKNLLENNVGAENLHNENLTVQSLTEMFYMNNNLVGKGLMSLNHNSLMKAFLTATHNTWQALKLAEKNGAAINGFGGFHHAKWSGGQGFCPIEDIVFAMNNQWKEDVANGRSESKFLIVDLDYHPDNGPESYFNQEEIKVGEHKLLKGHLANKAHLVKILDYYIQYPEPVAAEWPPRDTEEKLVQSPANKDCIKSRVFRTENVATLKKKKVLAQSQDYLDFLKKDLKEMIDEQKPDFVIYVNGTDAYSGVNLEGKFNSDAFPGNGLLNMQQMIDRDQTVFEFAKEANAKVLMLPAGGYHKDCPVIMAKSTKNLIDKGLLPSRVSI